MNGTHVDPDSSPADDLRAWYEIHRAAHVRDRPRQPVPSEQHTIGLLSPDPGRVRSGRLFRDEHGTPVATALIDLWQDAHLAHLAAIEVVVRPHFRRRGIGGRLVDRLAVSATRLGRESLITRAVRDSDGAAFCVAAGFSPVLERVESVLELRSASRAAIARRAGGVAGYRLEAWTGACPDRLLSGYATVLGALGDQPLGDLDIRRSFEVSPDAVRAAEALAEARHQRPHVVCAVDDRSGEVVGATCVDVGDESSQAMQGATAVLADHRGHGLGLWLKAAMAARLTETEPQVRRVETTTAVDNRAMRRINDALGFRVVVAVTEFQRSLEAAPD